VQGLEHSLGVGQETGAHLCEANAPAGPLEEPLTKISFQRLDARGYGGLGQEQRLSRAAEAALICHLNECFKLA
jgi:hypothetical protein